ncbi:14845_t:CDS:1, partial [Racocetra persica]
QGTEPFTKTQAFERGNYIFFDPSTWEKVKKEYILMYEALEERPTMLSSMGGSSSSSSLSSLSTPSLQQAAAAQQNLASSSMNMANLMNLGNLSSTVGGASGLNPGSLAGLGAANPAQLQQLHHQYPTGATNSGSHHQLGGPGLVQGGHYIAQ